MTSVTLNWLVLGENPYEKALPVDIDINKNIGALKKAIKNDISESVSARDLKLFKVAVPLGITRDKNVITWSKSVDPYYNFSSSLSYSSIIPNTYLFLCFSFLLLIVEQPVAGNKRRRISDFESDNSDNESLTKVWNAFKSATLINRILIMSEEVSYLLGVDDIGNKLFTIFVRSCYDHLSRIIFAGINLRRWRISGNPGIGKTFLSCYLLYQLAKNNETVIYHQHGRSAILFSEK
ncbi:hypothetical protein RclHR1_10070004 [Rhizophagus clarus]|uniref:Crinkler effector protein N-terminal domain-containing protein n=1 Tax=Rhizophagus clarus TaxID=94130 RepID=A0A2Z6Q596_9GLOM|nr:hypothetical protein RclHR1_10070004 [Rhizophagus clarus]